MNLKRLLLSPKGRAGRRSFWLFTVLVAVAGAVTGVLDLTLFGPDAGTKPISSFF